MYKSVLHKLHSYGTSLLLVYHGEDAVEKIKIKSQNEKDIVLEKRQHFYFLNKKREQELYKFYKFYSPEESIEIFNTCRMPLLEMHGIIYLADVESRFYNVVNHHRVTTDVPEKYCKTVYFFGDCCATGIFAEDSLTIESQLQRKFNEKYPETIRVVNAANWQTGPDALRQILSPSYVFGRQDLVVLVTNKKNDFEQFSKAMEKFGNESIFACADLSAAFQRPHRYGEIFFDGNHMQHDGYAMIADILFPAITNLLCQGKDAQKVDTKKNIDSYLSYLKNFRKKFSSGKGIIGSIAMNCNPFTIGHKFLVDEALKKCDFLYIFVLDTDKSFFKFDDRITMVRLALKNYDNVCVIPSGKMIISEYTMPEYFNKENIQDKKVDVTNDIAMFCTTVAPCLDITKRFVGTEPICKITKQYNDMMRETLPRYGIDFVEIERLKINNDYVSASLVRKCIKNNDFSSVQALLPNSSYEYLLSNKFLREDLHSPSDTKEDS